MFGRKRQVIENNDDLQAPDGIETVDIAGVQNDQQALTTLANLFDVYRPGVVFSEPVQSGDVTVITASEVYVGVGLGLGRGYGRSEGDTQGVGGGGGFGGGGASAGRPTAAIIIDAKGVRVEPVVDVTKIALAFFTMLGALLFTWRRMMRRRK
jgi:uncharacterized spore protein YtfJ